MNNFRIKLECANILSFEIEIKFVHLSRKLITNLPT